VSELRADLTALKTTAVNPDPVRLRYIESLLCKAEQAEGALASLLQTRVRDALADYRAAARRGGTSAPGDRARPDTGLSGLVRLLNEHHGEEDDPDLAPLDQTLRQQELDLVGQIAEQSSTAVKPRREELRAARRLQNAMVRQNADKVVTQALAGIPQECGPLNPQRLATRSLETMRDLSPHYLSRFVSYIDTLFWLENAGMQD
jgi:hypothetical protein